MQALHAGIFKAKNCQNSQRDVAGSDKRNRRDKGRLRVDGNNGNHLLASGKPHVKAGNSSLLRIKMAPDETVNFILKKCFRMG